MKVTALIVSDAIFRMRKTAGPHSVQKSTLVVVGVVVVVVAFSSLARI